jgi:ATP-binding cassette subfamily F protein 3
MDEPTNHLDLASSESLAASLGTFDGTLVFVSHNRSLIRTLATRIWNVEDQRVETYPGTLDEYMYSMAQRRIAVAAADDTRRRDPRGAVPRSGKADAGDAVGGAGAGALPRDKDKERKRREAEARQKRSVKLGPLEKSVAQLEDRIAVLEAEQKTRAAELADPSVYDEAARRNKLLSDYQTASDKLEELTARWEAAMAALETAKAELGDTG